MDLSLSWSVSETAVLTTVTGRGPVLKASLTLEYRKDALPIEASIEMI